jgi:NAD(P)H-hydrate epimerase
MRLPTRLSNRKADSHKGDYGHLLVIAGSNRFSGAAILSGTAALRGGAGMVTLGIPASINNAVIRSKIPELMTLPLPDAGKGTLIPAAFTLIKKFSVSCNVLLIGPGLECTPGTRTLVRKLAREINLPKVLDADGLNAFAGSPELLRQSAQAGLVITPHPGEMARLLGLTVPQVQAQRKKIAVDFARKYGITVVLKGHHTLVAGPDGRSYINHTGNPGMATAGSGDVLAGMLAAFLGQRLDCFTAAKFAVYLHGLAGDMAVREKTKISLIAGDIIDKIPQAIKRVLPG